MKKLLFLVLFTALTILPSSVFAQGMMNWQSQTNTAEVASTAADEAKGKAVWDKLQVKQIACKDLKDDDFEVLGEYFMGKSIGNTQQHAAMNLMMQSMMGQQGEEQMHVVMGKRLSICDTSFSYPNSSFGFMPMMGMMQMMGGGGNPMMGYGGWNNMMGGFGIFGWLFMIIFWLLLILVVIALIRYLTRSGKDKESRTPLDILKERYARGEINKKELEEKMKDLG